MVWWLKPSLPAARVLERACYLLRAIAAKTATNTKLEKKRRKFNGQMICKFMHESKRSKLAGFFNHKEGTHSFSHLRKMLKACQRAVILIPESKEFAVRPHVREQ